MPELPFSQYRMAVHKNPIGNGWVVVLLKYTQVWAGYPGDAWTREVAYKWIQPTWQEAWAEAWEWADGWLSWRQRYVTGMPSGQG